jgi:hypothetical protein
MAEYIDVASLLLAFGEEPIVWTGSDCELQARGDYRYYKAIIENIPTADVVEVRHGKWISASQKKGVNIGMKCSLCGARIKYSEFFNGNHNYCHKCGAKMDGKGEDV